MLTDQESHMDAHLDNDGLQQLMLQLKSAQNANGTPSVFDSIFNSALVQSQAESGGAAERSPAYSSEPATPTDLLNQGTQQAADFMAKLLGGEQSALGQQHQQQQQQQHTNPVSDALSGMNSSQLLSLLSSTLSNPESTQELISLLGNSNVLPANDTQTKRSKRPAEGASPMPGFELSQSEARAKMPRLQAEVESKGGDLLDKLDLAGMHALLQKTNPVRSPTTSPENVTPPTPHMASVPTSSESAQAAQNVLSQLLPGLQMPFNFPLLMNSGFPGQLPLGNELDMARMAQFVGHNVPPPVPKTPKRQYSSTSKNYCDLCNKEVCNKYFLRTHMLKMHNIVIDENKSVIANIDTLEKEKEGGLSFRCDLCKMKLDTRSELRDHKKDVHGIMPLNTSHAAAHHNNNNHQHTGSSASSDCEAQRKTPTSASSATGPVPFPDPANEFPKLEPQDTAAPSSSASSTTEVDSCPVCAGKMDADKLTMHLMNHHLGQMTVPGLTDANKGEDQVLMSVEEAALRFARLREDFNRPNKEEKHSHTSGSASPLSVNIPEGYFQPLDPQAKLQTQPFVMRFLNLDPQQGQCLPEELLAYLPVRQHLGQPLKLTIELRPADLPQPKEV